MSPLVAFILILIGCGYISAIPEDETPIVRIVGGQRADIKTIPYQVSLGSNGRHFCGGAIISTRAVLTAAHCTNGKSSSRFTVRAGSSLHASGGQLVRVAKVHNHPNFNRKNLDNDIAVVTLASALTFGPSVKAIPLPSGQIAVGKMGVVSGWGTTGEKRQTSSYLQKVEVNIYGDSQCKTIYRSMTSNMFCAGFMGGGKDSCQGDSGGPLVNGNSLTGIVSWGRGCARKGFPGVYTNVCRYVTWIKSKL